MSDEAKRVRVRCSAGCGWTGQRKLPSTCPACPAPLEPIGGKPGPKRGTVRSDRVRTSIRLKASTRAYLAGLGDVATEAARRVEKSVESEREAAQATVRRGHDSPSWAERHAFDDDGP